MLTTDALAGILTAFGLIAFLGAGARTQQILPALQLALEFWLAAGLIRLSGHPSWPAIATAASIVAIRKLAGVSLTRRFDAAHLGMRQKSCKSGE